MSGRRDHDGEPTFPFGEQLKSELRGLLALLLKNTARHRVTLLEMPGWTSYQTDFHTDVIDVDLQQSFVGVSPNAVRFSAANAPVKHMSLLTADTVGLHTGRHLPESRIRQVPALATEANPLRTMNPEPLIANLSQDSQLSLTKCESVPSHLWSVSVSTTNASPIDTRFSGKVQSRASQVLPHRTLFQSDTTRMNRLAIRKRPVPLHRFSLAMRQRFRQALAEKSGAAFEQIQLLLVFDRMDMTLYSSILKDEQGDLLCTPKTALQSTISAKKHASPPRGIERWRERTRAEEQQERTATPDSLLNAYLIIGLRLDTKQEIRALIPMSDRIDSSNNDFPEEGSHD